MRTLLLTIVVTAASCGVAGETGAQGALGDKGPTGEQGPRGEPGYSGLVWVDATGTLVGPYAESPVYVDDAGVLWPVNAETAQVELPTRDTAVGWYESADCSGAAYSWANLPGTAYLMPSGAGVGATRAVVRPATIMSVNIRAHSQRGESMDCAFADTPALMVPSSSLIEVTPPATEFAAPLRLAIQ